MTLLKSEKDSAERISSAIKKGKIVIIPTDTVYGFSGIVSYEPCKFGTDKIIREIKGRGEKKPFIELLSEPESIYNYTDRILPQEIFGRWPGPLTIIVENNARYKKITGRDTTAFRCPKDEWLRKVIRLCEAPIYSTSVNRSGRKPLHSVAEICAEFESEVEMIVSDGDKAGAKPSAIVSFLEGTIKTIRE